MLFVCPSKTTTNEQNNSTTHDQYTQNNPLFP
jgi:hypothetical protein